MTAFKTSIDFRRVISDDTQKNDQSAWLDLTDSVPAMFAAIDDNDYDAVTKIVLGQMYIDTIRLGLKRPSNAFVTACSYIEYHCEEFGRKIESDAKFAQAVFIAMREGGYESKAREGVDIIRAHGPKPKVSA